MTKRFYVIVLAAVAICSPLWADGGEALWNIAWITDTQTPACEWITALTRALAANKPKMVIHTGDARFEWANQCAWQATLELMRIEVPPLEFHLAPGNHDDEGQHVLKKHLSRAATEGVYILDTGELAPGQGYYHNRKTREATGPEWPVWNPEVARHPNWPVGGKPPYRYVFKRGNIRFILCDCYWSQEQQEWIRDLIVRPDDSSATIILQHEHTLDRVAGYVAGLEGRHNVRLMLTGHDHNYRQEKRHGVTFITGAGVAEGNRRDADAMTLWVYKDHLRLDRYLILKGSSQPAVQGPETIWKCRGSFAEYQRPKWPEEQALPVPAPETRTRSETLGPDLLHNGSFDNGIWYERFRGWSPAGWYQWFTCGDDAPEHTVGKDRRHSGKEYVRIHMWAHAWRGGILQNVRGVEPCHWYRMTAYGWFAKTADDPQPHARIGVDPCGKLREQYSVDITKHPAPPYNECVGDDPKTPDVDWPDIPETTVWSAYRDHYDRWGRFEVVAEARSDTVTAILYCNPKQRPPDQPIYEMNWDTVSLREVPWPTRRLVQHDAVLPVHEGIKKNVVLTLHPDDRNAYVTWRTDAPAGASQVLYRFLDSEGVNHFKERDPKLVRMAEFPFASPVVYERSATSHCIEIDDLTIPDAAEEIHFVALSRALIDGECHTLCSPLQRVRVPCPAL